MTDKLNKNVLKVFKKAWYPKFLATVDEGGIPNIVPVLTLKAEDESTLIFARFMVWKTAANLERVGRCLALCMGPGRRVWAVKGDFVGFEKEGPRVEEFNKLFLFRYNAYAGVEQVGVIRVREALLPEPVRWVKTLFSVRKAARAASRSSTTDGVGPMPVQVARQFARKAALKYLAHCGPDGYPVAHPALTLFPLNRKSLVFKDIFPIDMDEGADVAACVFNRDIIAYQVKGKYAGLKAIGRDTLHAIDVERVYTASPPLPGKEIGAP